MQALLFFRVAFQLLLLAVAAFNWKDKNFLGIGITRTEKMVTDIFPVYQR